MSLLQTATNDSIPVDAPRPAEKPLGFSWGGNVAIIDNDWKLMTKPNQGQCDYQEPYSSMTKFDDYYLFNLAEDYHELHDKKGTEQDRFNAMRQQMTAFLASIANSQENETKCKTNP